WPTAARRPRVASESQVLPTWFAQRYESLCPRKFQWKIVKPQCVPPATQRFQQHSAPLREVNILHGWPAGVNHQFKVINAALHARRQPGKARVLADCEVKPTFAGPLVRCPWKLDFSIYLAVHSIGVRGRDVMLNNDFGFRVEAFNLPDKSNRVARILSGRGRTSYYKRELGHDAELTDACG